MRINVLSYNIHKGFGFRGAEFTLHSIREAIRSVEADIVFLQEVVGENFENRDEISGWPDASQFEFLADSVWSHYVYGKNAIYSEGHHGNAILSKFPFRSWDNINISNSRWERRGLLHGVLALPESDADLHVICLHLDLLHGGRLRQIARLRDQIRSLVPRECPLIVAGDFNDWQDGLKNWEREVGLAEVHRVLHGEFAKTYPAFFPFLPLDRIYFRGLIPISASRKTEGTWSIFPITLRWLLRFP